MTPAEERDYLERVLAGTAQPTLGPAATCGRLAQLYVEDAASNSGFAARALVLVSAALQLEAPDGAIYPKLKHFQAAALRAVKDPPENALGLHGLAAEAEREAWKRSLPSNPRDAMAMAGAWGDWAWERDRFDEASEAYSCANRAQANVILWEEDVRGSRTRALAGTKYATRSAYAFLKTGDPRSAILELERVSSYTLNASFQIADLRRLADVNPELRAKLLGSLESQKQARQRNGLDSFGRISEEERAARDAADALTREVRKIAGFDGFGRGTQWSEVAQAAAAKPLVYLFPTAKGSAAIGVFAVDDPAREQPARDVKSVEIPATLPEVYEAFLPFARAEYEGDGDSKSALFEALNWLGAHVCMYVKFLLGVENEIPFVLIPFELYASLPVHAGGVTLSKSPRTVFHPRHVTFAYSARQVRGGQDRVGRALVVNNPRPLPPNFDPLALSDWEAKLVQKYFAADVLVGRAASTEKVIALLPRATLAHFSCHGTVDSQISYSGVLLLADTQELNYHQLRTAAPFQASLVVLSACRSGQAALGVETTVNLPNAFLAAGVQAVLGTFWHTDEMASLLLLTRFYELWREKGLRPVEALGDAQSWIIRATAEELLLILDPEVLQSPAAEGLTSAPASEQVYAHPWYWAGFFVAGA